MSPPKAGAQVKETEKDTLEAGVLSMVREGEVGALLLAPGNSIRVLFPSFASSVVAQYVCVCADPQTIPHAPTATFFS